MLARHMTYFLCTILMNDFLTTIQHLVICVLIKKKNVEICILKKLMIAD